MNTHFNLKDVIKYYIAIRLGLYARNINNLGYRLLFVLGGMKIASTVTNSEV